MQCDMEGCLMPALYSLRLSVPAQSDPDKVNPLRIMIAVRMCAYCIDDVELDEWLTAELKVEIFKMFGRSNVLRPDFKRAWIEKIDINSPEFIEFMRHVEGGG